jgi:hypothetical protein
MKLLDPKTACEYLLEHYGLHYKPKSLSNRRNLGLDPKFVRLARRWPRYTTEALDEFAHAPPADKPEK